MEASADNGSWIDQLITDNALSPALQRVADVIVRNPRLAAFADTNEMALHADVNSSSVARCAQALGYKGWPDLQQNIRGRYLASLSIEETIRERADQSSNPVIQAMSHDIDNMRNLADVVDVEAVEDAARLIAKSRSTIVVAAGAVLGPAQVLAHLGRVLGYPLRIESADPTTLASVLNIIDPDDVIVIFSHWRALSDVVTFASAAVQRRATIITVTDSQSNDIAQLSDRVLVAPSEGSLFFQSVTAMTSLVYAILTCLADQDPEAYRESVKKIQKTWASMEIFHDK